jgi:hypothetical protein
VILFVDPLGLPILAARAARACSLVLAILGLLPVADPVAFLGIFYLLRVVGSVNSADTNIIYANT